MNIGIWVLRVLLGLAFLLASYMKLSGQPRMVAEFDVVGLGQWFRHFTATLELIGGLAILVPRTSVFGAIVLLMVDLGAFVANVTISAAGLDSLCRHCSSDRSSGLSATLRASCLRRLKIGPRAPKDLTDHVGGTWYARLHNWFRLAV